MKRLIGLTALLTLTTLCAALPAQAQELSLNLGEGGGGLTERIVQIIALITILSLAPSILVMVTSFIRIVVVLSILRMAMGLQQSPPNTVMISLALFLTGFIMMPVFNKAYEEGLQPLMAEEIETMTAIERAAEPFRGFMLAHAREKDIGLFLQMGNVEKPEGPEGVPFRVLIPAFMISELRRAFEIGFLLFVPFLVIDMVVASVLMAMGMMMLPPVIISLPFKLIFFVLVDGWFLVVGSLVQSFGTG